MIWNLPNKLTVSRVVMIPFFVACLLYNGGGSAPLRALALCIFCAASFTDYLDGMLARRWNQVSTFGKFMDPLADKLLVCSALICMVELRLLPAWAALLVVSREFIISGFRLIAAEQGVVIAASMWGKAKTVSQMACIIALLIPAGEAVPETAKQLLIILMSALTIISLADYLIKNRRILEERTE